MKFYHRIPDSVIRVPVVRHGAGLLVEVAFTGGMIDTDDTVLRGEDVNLAVEAALLPLADQPGTGVSTASDSDVDAAVQKLKNEDIRKAAEAAQTKLVKAGEKP